VTRIRTFCCACVGLAAGVASLPAAATSVTAFEVGTAARPTEFVAPAVMHGTYAFDLIRVTFDTDVFVDFYDLKLGYIGADSNTISISGYSYDHATHTAIWNISGQQQIQNARYRAVLSGIWDAGGVPLTGGGYTNEFTVLTGDVTGDNAVNSADDVLLQNHISGGLPYDPALDVDWSGAVSPMDRIIVIGIGGASLVSAGAYTVVPRSPPSDLRLLGVTTTNETVRLRFSALPAGSVGKAERKLKMSDLNWATIQTLWVSNGMDEVTFPMLPGSTSEFYRISFQ
jgi:hypothetical protein